MKNKNIKFFWFYERLEDEQRKVIEEAFRDMGALGFRLGKITILK